MKFKAGEIHQADCVAGMAAMPAGTVDLAFADPPFNIGYEYDVYDDRQEADEYLAWSRRWIEAVHRVLKPTGTFWLAIGDEFAAELKVLSQQIGFTCRSWVIWYYTFGVNCTRKFNRSHAHLFHFVKDAREFTFNDAEIRVPSARQLVYADARANPVGRLPDDTWILRPQDIVEGLTPDEDLWYFPRVAGTFKERMGFHGCQMPEQLLGRIIRVSSNPGELVLDPFSGSATTLTVARKLGRAWIGFEISEEYAQRGRTRVAAARPGDPLVGAEEPRVSAPPTQAPRTPKPATRRRQNSKPTAAAPLQPPPSIMDSRDAQRALIEAFAATSDGYSVDRVVTDPDLNAAFLAECGRLGVPGSAADRNRTLFRLRKTGRLVHLPTTRRTEFDWVACDGYLFASEIALRKMMECGACSLDDVLCSPEQAVQFDDIAREFAPGYTAFQYRWAALKLRKEARLVRSRSARLGQFAIPHALPLAGDQLARIADEPGVYLLSDASGTPLYAGESVNLRQRIACHRDQAPRAWSRYGDGLHVAIAPLPDVKPADSLATLFAHQSRLISQHTPRLNYLPLAVI